MDSRIFSFFSKIVFFRANRQAYFVKKPNLHSELFMGKHYYIKVKLTFPRVFGEIGPLFLVQSNPFYSIKAIKL